MRLAPERGMPGFFDSVLLNVLAALATGRRACDNRRMSYTVKEIFYTLQGEGANTGRAAVFLRFSGCNLWSGREADRATAECQFCDTDFVGVDGVGGGRFETAAELAAAVTSCWTGPASLSDEVAGAHSTPQERGRRLVVCTGGEPLLQLDPALIDALHDDCFEIAVETNGTLPAPRGIDWLCVSPKAGSELVLNTGNELKLVYPQSGLDPAQLSRFDFQHFFLQPMDGPQLREHTQAAVEYCLTHPQWRISLQTHKLLGIR